MGTLPKYIIDQLPRSTYYRWLHENPQKYYGSELNQLGLEWGDKLQTITQYPVAMEALLKCIKVYTSIVSIPKQTKKLVSQSKAKVIDTIERIKKLIPLKDAVEIFNISTSTYYSWLIEVKSKCEDSYFRICNKLYPSQLTKAEVLKIKELLTCSKLLHWPIRSVQAYAFREKLILASLSTWYKLRRVLGLRPTNTPVSKKDRKHKPVTSDFPNQKWHADITEYRTADGLRHYIYLVVDNFSKYIISYAISKNKDASHRVKTLEEAYQKAKKVSDNLNVDLIVDGGSENNNIYVDKFIERGDINMRKLVALRDVNHSNSTVEAVNKVIKYRYLFIKPIPKNEYELHHKFDLHVTDYNDVRPHGSLIYQTPYESWIGLEPDKTTIRLQMQEASKMRVVSNQNTKCRVCKALL